jgi:AraC-like DNA-binding protein
MPSSSVQSFSDPDDYAAGIPAQAQVEVTVTERGRFTAEFVNVHLDHLAIRRFSDSLSRVMHATLGPRSVFWQFSAGSSGGLRADGLEYQSTNVVRHPTGVDLHLYSSGSTQFAGLLLKQEGLAAFGDDVAQLLAPPRSMAMSTPKPAAMARLQRLHAASVHLAETAPEIIANPNAATGLEQALIDAMVNCLSEHEAHASSRVLQQHTIVMRRFRGLLEENPEKSLYIPEICKAIGVSDRTLLICCHQYLGMGPRRYLALRRLHLVRRALRQATLGTTTVTNVATQYGFWHLSRFAREYQSLFGEPPSKTLQREVQ